MRVKLFLALMLPWCHPRPRHRISTPMSIARASTREVSRTITRSLTLFQSPLRPPPKHWPPSLLARSDLASASRCPYSDSRLWRWPAWPTPSKARPMRPSSTLSPSLASRTSTWPLVSGVGSLADGGGAISCFPTHSTLVAAEYGDGVAQVAH